MQGALPDGCAGREVAPGQQAAALTMPMSSPGIGGGGGVPLESVLACSFSLVTFCLALLCDSRGGFSFAAHQEAIVHHTHLGDQNIGLCCLCLHYDQLLAAKLVSNLTSAAASKHTFSSKDLMKGAIFV
jgi:hypothetical protein